MMGNIIAKNGGSVTLADMPKAIIAQIQAVAQIDYSDDPSWVAHCIELNCLPAWSKAAKAMKQE
jgi:hypothetical protein